MSRWLVHASVGLLLVTFVSCGGSQYPCATSGRCGPERRCVAGACRPNNQVPTESGAHKVVLVPDRIAVVTSSGRQPWDGAEIPFGRTSEGHVVLLLRFPSPLRETSRLVAAVLVLDPMPGAPPSPSLVPVGVARILRPWSPQETTWSRLPMLSEIEGTALASTWGKRPLYIDVTRQVWRWRECRADDQGLALVASPRDELGAVYALGVGGGRSPRLDLYLR